MNKTFLIVKLKANGETYLAKPYWLDPSSKVTLFCKYKEGTPEKMNTYGIMNEYRVDVEIVGHYTSEKYSVSNDNTITPILSPSI